MPRWASPTPKTPKPSLRRRPARERQRLPKQRRPEGRARAEREDQPGARRRPLTSEREGLPSLPPWMQCDPPCSVAPGAQGPSTS
eukprot:10092112-Alexandrium_andersonii.AAC.1